MLGNWRIHEDYCEFVRENLKRISRIDPNALYEYEKAISKLYLLNLDKLKEIIFWLYSTTGRPSHFQGEIFRSFVLMNMLKMPLDKWIYKLQHNTVLQTAIGVTYENIPCASSHYDFINRIIKMNEKPRTKQKKCKPTKKLGKNVKLPNRHPNIVQRLVEKVLEGQSFSNRPEKILQIIFARISVDMSLELGIISKHLDVSGDGTCLKTGASPYGVKICTCKAKGIYKCDCARRYSDPNATWGWDNTNDRYFYGYTAYFLSTYNSALKLDIPLFLRLVEAKRHDSVTAVVAINEFRELYPNLTMDTFIHDAATDNYATYTLLDTWNINSVISLNMTSKGKFTYPQYLLISDHGIPICPNGTLMGNWGFDKARNRLKYRCPLALGKIPHCKNKVNCSPSDYGRTIYTKPSWDLRLFTRIPRGSDLWRQKMKTRTSIERLNNKVLHHYGIEHLKVRGKKRYSFFTMIAGCNIHLDIQLDFLRAKGSFDFYKLFIHDLAS